MKSQSLILISALILGQAVSVGRGDWENEVARLNSRPSGERTWEAKLHDGIDYNNPDALKKMASLKIDRSDKGDNVKSSGPRLLQTVSLPSTLDLRVKYPKCWSIGNIRNQGQCGSCWAVSSSTALSDRYCIVNSNSTVVKQRSFSYEDPLECCTTCGFASKGGCDGGYLTGGFSFAKANGTVGGENYLNNTLCKPYFLSPAATTLAVAPACSAKCSNVTTSNAASLYTADKIKIKGYYVYDNYYNTSASMIQAMKTGLTLRGSLVASMDVYKDFYAYKSGVYIKNSTVYYGGHAIRLIGWGNFNSTLSYWIGANSWGTNWGIAGYFWIRMGKNEVGIESYVADGYFV